MLEQFPTFLFLRYHLQSFLQALIHEEYLEDLHKLDLYITKEWSNGVILSFKGENLTNEVVEIVPGYDNFGRQYHLTLDYKWQYNMDIDWLICCLCGEVIEDFMESHNPQPLGESVDDRCCNLCNLEKVIPSRIMDLQNG